MTTKTTRRGFIGVAGLAAAATALPSVAGASGLNGWRWGDLRESLLPQLRAAYLAEVERFAEENRPQIESGEFGECDDDMSPRYALEDACGDRFGCRAVETEDGRSSTGDAGAALWVLAASPSADDEVHAGFFHVAQAAQSALGTDVLAIARKRGWIRKAA